MSERKRLHGGTAQVPEWASFFTPAEFENFVDLVLAHFRSRQREARHEDGVLHFDANGRKQQFGLCNLAQLCHQNELDEWQELIGAHFDNMERSSRELEQVHASAADFSKVAHLLKARIYPADATFGRTVTRPLAPGLVLGLAYDLPSSVASVPREDASAWGLDEDELFRRALANVEADGLLEREELDLDGQAQVTALVGASFFSSTHALLLDRYFPGDSPYGVLFAAPNRHIVLAHRLEDPGAVAAINAMLAIARRRFEEGPGSLSPDLYWKRGDSLLLLPSRLEDGNLVFAPPDELIETLEALGQRH